MNFNLKSFLRVVCIMAAVSFTQMMYGQYVNPDVAVTKLQAEVVKYQNLANNPHPNGTGVLTSVNNTSTPPSIYVAVMENMIAKITETKKVDTAVAEWEQILNQQTGVRRANLKTVLDHVKTVLK